MDSDQICEQQREPVPVQSCLSIKFGASFSGNEERGKRKEEEEEEEGEEEVEKQEEDEDERTGRTVLAL
ncbi:hypothetical protein V1477_002343 [Vespula maculifrons]|uniref:Uncharacterized protein n=1 Tax=Vespula maculifrons TaxID=7453 RepID=A0ABD2CZ37_VESMC